MGNPHRLFTFPSTACDSTNSSGNSQRSYTFIPSSTTSSLPTPKLNQTATMLIPKADRKAIHEYIFREGVMVCEKNYELPKHPDVDVKNLYVIKACQSLTSRGYLKTQFAWQYYYYTLTPKVLTTSANGFTCQLRLSLRPTSSSNARTLLHVARWVVTNANDVVVAVAVLEEIVRADTVVVILVRAKKVVRRASLLLPSVVDSVVVAVLLLAPKQFDLDLA